MTQRFLSLIVALLALAPLAAMASEHTIDISDADLQAEVYESDIPVVIDCWAPWCGPCRMMGPEFEKAAAKFEGKVKFCKYNVDNNSELCNKHDIRGIPTMLFYGVNEDFKGKLVGFHKADQIISAVKKRFELSSEGKDS